MLNVGNILSNSEVFVQYFFILITQLNGELQKKASVSNPTLIFNDIGNGKVEFRRSGERDSYALSLVYTNASGLETFHSLIDLDGSRLWVMPYELEQVKTSFQAGVNVLYNKCVNCGVTPADKTPTVIANAIQVIHDNRYNEGYEDGQSTAIIQTRDVAGNNTNFGNYNTYGLSRSVKINAPSISGYTVAGAYIKAIYIENTNNAFTSGMFEVLKQNNNEYYVISKDCEWTEGITSVNVTITFVYQKS